MNRDVSYFELFKACRVLFGQEIELSADFLQYLQHDGVKAAFRRRAKETHPDLSGHLSLRNPEVDAERFRRANEAYELLGTFIRNRGKHGRTDKDGAGLSRKYEKPPQSVRHAFHSGPIPCRPLPLGRYLYYRGVVPFRTLLDALTWQRGCRKTIGSIAREWGWLSFSDVEAVLAVSPSGRFGENAVRCGLLNPLQVKLLLVNQRSRKRRIGEYFVVNNIVSRQRMERLAQEQLRHNLAYGRQ